jgi:hypothetical protein
MKSRVRATSLFLTLLLGATLTALPVVTGVATGADTFFVSVQTVEERIDCVTSYLRVEKEMDVPEDFKTESGMMRQVNALATLQGIPTTIEDPDLAVNDVIVNVAKELLADPMTSKQSAMILTAMVENIDDVNLDYCTPEGYEPFEEADQPLDRRNDSEKNDYKRPNPQPEPEFVGFRYYGEPYDLDSEVYLSENGFLVFSRSPFETVAFEQAYLDHDGEDEPDFLPPLIAPLWIPDSDGGADMALNPDPVTKTEDYYEHGWTLTRSNETLETAAVTASLYRNEWIKLAYEQEVLLDEDGIYYGGGYGGWESGMIQGLIPGSGVGADHPGPGVPRDWDNNGIISDVLYGPTPGFSSYPSDGAYVALTEQEYGVPFPSFFVYRPYTWDATEVGFGEKQEPIYGYSYRYTPETYTVTGAQGLLVGDRGSIDKAISNIMNDPNLPEGDNFVVDPDNLPLLFRVDDVRDANGDIIKHGEFKPGEFLGYGGYWNDEGGYNYWSGDTMGFDNYTYGDQRVGEDYDGAALFINEDILEYQNNAGLLAYMVQVDEDAVNQEILRMYRDKVAGDLRDTIANAMDSQEILDRDALLTEIADAQSGRVTRDRKGNRVRSQQYILRPDDNTVTVLNVTKRESGAGNLAGLSMMDFTTKFTGQYSKDYDLRTLPWSEWLNTQSVAAEGQPVRYVWTESSAPELASMYVKFTNPVSDSLQEIRTFAGVFQPEGFDRPLQEITGDQLTLATLTTSAPYSYVTQNPEAGEYTISAGVAGGFDYVLGDGGNVNVSLYAVGDGQYEGDTGVNYYYTEYDANGAHDLKDMWDAMRVNEPGAPNVDSNVLEIAIDKNAGYFSQPIDVIYIPMSRMLWKDKNIE